MTDPKQIAETVARLMSERWCVQDASGKLWANDTPLNAADLLQSFAAENAALKADMSNGSFYKETDIDALQARAKAAEAEQDRLAAELAEARAGSEPPELQYFYDGTTEPRPNGWHINQGPRGVVYVTYTEAGTTTMFSSLQAGLRAWAKAGTALTTETPA